MSKLRNYLQEQFPDCYLLFMDPSESYDQAIIGVAEGIGIDPTVAYDYDKIIEANCKMGMSLEEAEKYFSYNQEGAYVGKHTPIFIKKITKE